MLCWLLFSSKSIQNILILSAIVAPFASAGIRPVENREPFFRLNSLEKVTFDRYNFGITRLSARKSEQMKNF